MGGPPAGCGVGKGGHAGLRSGGERGLVEEEEAVPGQGAGSGTYGRGLCHLEASGRPCPLVEGGGKAAIGCHVGGWQPREGSTWGSTGPRQPPCSQDSVPTPSGTPASPNLPFQHHCPHAASRSVCLSPPHSHWAFPPQGLCSSGLLCLECLSFKLVSDLQASCRAPPPETLSPSPTALSLPRRLDLIFLVTRSLCGWEGSASSLGSPHQLSLVSQARRDLRAVLHTLDVF